MKNIFIYIVALSSLLLANSDDTCKRCHSTIYSEFHNSMHKKASPKNDKIHNSIWNLHPAKAKDNYKCAKCHTPNVETKEQRDEGISCISCHTITNVEEHSKANKNIYETKEKTFFSAQKGMEDKKVTYKQESSFFGMIKTSTGSPYHDIDYTNKDYYTGKMCMGCHSHKQNAHQFEVCTTDASGAKDKEQNCITCHMPQVAGTATAIRESKTHAFHGFAGARNNPEMLAKYIKLDFKKLDNSFEVSVKNEAPHNLMTHPLRVVQLRVELKRDSKVETLKTHSFVKILGNEGKPAMPWVATEIFKDNMIKGNESRVVKFDKELKSGDQIEVKLGFFVVNPKVVKKLGLQDDKEITKFTTLKSKWFTVK